MVRSVEERLAVLEEQNDSAKPMHERFGKDIATLKTDFSGVKATVTLLKWMVGALLAGNITIIGFLLVIVTD